MRSADPATRSRWTRRPADAVSVIAGLVVLAAGMVAVRDGSVSDAEESAFRAVNDLPGALYPVLWPFQQLGALVAGPVAAAVAAGFRRYRLAVALLLATVAKLGLERVVKAMVSRQRPGTSIGSDIHARGTVSLHGESFVSGHAVLVTAMAGVVAPYLRGRLTAVPWIVAAVVLVARVYVGAHNPLDVVCGAGLGVVIAGCLNLALGVPAAAESRP
jgi:undecaprenyl-diphosphatase